MLTMFKLFMFDRLQVVLDKFLWDNIVQEEIPARHFFDHFSLDRQYVLSQDVKDNIANSGIPGTGLQQDVSL